MVNFFYLENRDINDTSAWAATCAEYHGDKHLHKMIVEYAQIMSTVWHFSVHPCQLKTTRCTCTIEEGSLPAGLYKKSHIHHPVVLWCQKNIQHYNAMLDVALALSNERRRRNEFLPNNKKYTARHRTEDVLAVLQQFTPNIPNVEWMDPPKCMPSCYFNHDGKVLSTVESYRLFYAGHKIRIAKLKWHPIAEPEWMKECIRVVDSRPDIVQQIENDLKNDLEKKLKNRKRSLSIGDNDNVIGDNDDNNNGDVAGGVDDNNNNNKRCKKICIKK